MRTINQTTGLVLLLLLLIVSSCASPERLLRQGQNERAFDAALKQSSKKRPKDKHILALEEAYARMQAANQSRIEYLLMSGQPEIWPEINRLYRTIGARQQKIQNIQPLFISSEIRYAHFPTIDLTVAELESKQKAADYYYALALQNIELARTGDKHAARKAYDDLVKIDQYYRHFRDKEAFKAEALQLGINRIHFSMVNQSGAILPPGFQEELFRINTSDLQSRWVEIYRTRPEGIVFDYEVVTRIQRLDISPEVVREREYIDEKEIEDGFQYVLDPKGNVMKDSLGNDIKIPKYTTIRATVLEVHQRKSALVGGVFEIVDKRKGEPVVTAPLRSEAIFENFAATFRGDRRALSKESLNRLGNQPLPFPTNPDLVLQAAHQLKPFIRKSIVDNRRLLEF